MMGVKKMKYLLDHKEMKAVDMYSIQKIGIPSLVLMECAALKVAQHIREKINVHTRVIAVSGTGNNGADAVAAVRILHNAGFDTGVIFVGHQDKISEELKKQKEIIRNLGIPEYNRSDICLTEDDWLLDGIFGIGLTREIQGEYFDVIQWMNHCPAKICAVDIPSGIFADNGQILGCAVQADMTVSFGYMKKGLILYPGASYAGTIYIEDIGFAKGAKDAAAPKTVMLEKEDIKTFLPKRMNWSNKGTYGKLLVIAGAVNMCGAAVFSGKAAYQTGVGIVKIMTPEENRLIIGQSVPEAILETYNDDKTLALSLQEQIDWADAIVFGPGIGKQTHVHQMLEYLLTKQTKPLVIDADGLNVLSEHKEWLENHKCPVIITPHLGEMARLTGKTIQEIKNNLQATCEVFARQYHVTCVLKDARTMISDGEGLTFMNTSGNTGMSTGGSGDVLAGIIGGLVCQMHLIQKMPEECCKYTLVAALGAYIHGLAGDEAKKVCGTYGLLASDIIKYMKYVLGHIDN